MAEKTSEGRGMIDVTLRIGGLDLSNLLSTYTVDYEAEYQAVMTALDGTEYGSVRYRPIVNFSLIPITDEQASELFSSVSGLNANVVYTDVFRNTDITADMRITSNLQAVFGLRSINGNRYYKGGTITLRSRTVI